jgi:hypothetical protein
MKLLYIYNVLLFLRLNEHFMLMHSRVYNAVFGYMLSM